MEADIVLQQGIWLFLIGASNVEVITTFLKLIVLFIVKFTDHFYRIIYIYVIVIDMQMLT